MLDVVNGWNNLQDSGNNMMCRDHLDQSLKRSPTVARTSQLLVSVRNAGEAKIARDARVDWIDLKNPDAGPLGCPDLTIAQDVARILRGHPKSSVALGELVDLELTKVDSLSGLFTVLKTGLSGCAAPGVDWKSLMRTVIGRIALRAQLVPVIYADYKLCAAPEPSAVVSHASELGSQWMLIDTYTKDGRSLLDFLKLDELERLKQSAAAANITLVLAGSLTLSCVKLLMRLQPAVIAVRGAVCENGRRSGLSAHKIAQWLELIEPTLFPESCARSEQLA